MDNLNKHIKKTASFSMKAALMTFVALVGFVFGSCFVLSNKNAFHEINYEPKVVLDSMLSGPVVIDSVINKCTTDSCRNDARVRDTIMREMQYRRYLLNQLSDSAVERELVKAQLSINPYNFDDSCLVYFTFTEQQTDAQTKPILWDYYISYSLYYNRPITPYHISKFLVANATNFDTYMDFFTEYPGFVLWALLIILQFSLFPVLILFASILLHRFRKQFPDLADNRSITLNVLLSIAVIGVYFATSYLGFFHPNLLTNNLFYKNMLPTLIVLGGLVCIIGIVCFTGFTLISGIDFKILNDEPGAEERKAMITLYNELNSLFINLLIVSSIVLSLVVLTTGVLYTSINRMEFIQKIANDLGYSPLAYHYVIVIAVLSSVLLLLFFIPAKMHLAKLTKCIRKYDPDGKLADKAPDFMKLLQALFVVGLPIITGVLHSFISMFTK